MADTQNIQDHSGKTRPMRPLVIGLLLALVGGGAAFASVYFGLLPFAQTGGSLTNASVLQPRSDAKAETLDTSDIVFIPIKPVILSVGAGDDRMHLRFSAELEATRAAAPEIETLTPRIVDIVNTYLRAVKVADLEDPNALLRIRAQLLRRIQVVVGEGRVNDLLVMEFVLN